ncbi:hypothetical protein CBR_g31497 [Chara braunii]|uniref:peptidylprolyl isomerase n=1 Tax=Chara braunii TaxID=69332 RepID=A0A388LF68_CHABU|nr:hypothetical protein CBR_g31497 [Chara braunii]|eukprot:GBG80941.1 hypothetical protein CBR_g31497 [Chara braunii]
MALATLRGAIVHCDPSKVHGSNLVDGGDGTTEAAWSSRCCFRRRKIGGHTHALCLDYPIAVDLSAGRGVKQASSSFSSFSCLETESLSTTGRTSWAGRRLTCPALVTRTTARCPRVVCAAAAAAAAKSSSRSRDRDQAKKAEPKLEVKNAQVVAHPAEDGIVHVRVDVSAEDTQQVFDRLLVEMGKSAPPVPGFRRSKGGKTASVPKTVLINMLGVNRVKGFVVERIVNATLGEYVEKEGLKVKKDAARTRQSSEELLELFQAGQPFGFDADLELLPAEAAAESDGGDEDVTPANEEEDREVQKGETDVLQKADSL